MFSHRTTFYAIFFFYAFQTALTAGIPWSRLTVEKIGATRVTYKKEAWATDDTAEALIALVSAPVLAEAHKEQTNESEFEYLFVNTAYFAAGAPVPPTVSGKKGGKVQPVVGPPAYEALNSDRVQNQLATLYEDYTAAYFVKNLTSFIDLFCKRIYGETVEGFKLDSPYFDEIKAFKLSFMGGKVSIYSFMILDEASDPNYENRMIFGYQLSSLFPSSVPALLEQSASGWAAIIESLKSSTDASSFSALLAKPAFTTPIPPPPAPSGKKGKKKKGSSAAASVQPEAVFSPEQTSAFLAEIEAEMNKKKEAELKSKAAKEEQRRKQAEEQEIIRLAKEAKLKKEAEDRELQRKLQSEASREANRKKAEAKLIADEARMNELREKQRLEREQKEQKELQKQAEEQRFTELRKQKQEAELKRKQEAELKRKQQAELRRQQAELKLQQEKEAELKRQQDIELKKQQDIELKKQQEAELKKQQEAEAKQAEIERLAQEERNRKLQEEQLIRAHELQQAQMMEVANAERLRAETFRADNEKLMKEIEDIRRANAEQLLLEQQKQRELQQQVELSKRELQQQVELSRRELQQQIELSRRELQQQRLEAQRQRELQQRQAQNDYDSIISSTYSSPEDFIGSSGSSHSSSHFGSGSNRPVSLVQGASGPYEAPRNRYGNPYATEAPMTINTDAPAFYPPAAGSFDSNRSFSSQNSMFSPSSQDRFYSSSLQEVSPLAGLFGLGNSPFSNSNPALLAHSTQSPVFGSLTPQSHVPAPDLIGSARSRTSIEEELLSADLMNAIDFDS